MNNLIEHIQNKNFEAANVILEDRIEIILEQKLTEMKKMCAATEQSSHKERMKRLGMDVIEEDDVDEALLKIGKKNLKLKTPMARANASERPVGLEESEELDEARINIIKARIRGGVIQRRKKVSNVPGMTLRGGKLTRMSVAERRRRKLGARKAKLKLRGKQVQILRKRKLSLMKRKRLGL